MTANFDTCMSDVTRLERKIQAMNAPVEMSADLNSGKKDDEINWKSGQKVDS
jgi:hypothetical protein